MFPSVASAFSHSDQLRRFVSSTQNSNFIDDFLYPQVKSRPNQQALVWLNGNNAIVETESYQSLWTKTELLAKYFLSKAFSLDHPKLTSALKEGDRILLVYPLNGLEFIIIFIALLKAKLIPVPVYPPNPLQFKKTMPNLERVKEVVGCSVAFTSKEYKKYLTFTTFTDFPPNLLFIPTSAFIDKLTKELREVGSPYEEVNAVRLPKIQSSDVAFLQQTSGSTADPRAVIVTHQSLLVNCFAMHSGLRKFDVFNDFRMFSWLPMYHDMGLVFAYFLTLFYGGSGYYMSPIDFIRKPLTWITGMAKYRATISAAPNFAFDLVTRKWQSAPLKEKEKYRNMDLSSLHHINNAAEMVQSQTIINFGKTFEPFGFEVKSICPCYGLAEMVVAATSEQSLSLVHSTHPDYSHLVSCGIISELSSVLVNVKIVNPNTSIECKNGEVGEVWLNSLSKAGGYYNNEGKSKEVFQAVLSSESTEEEKASQWLRTGDLGFIERTKDNVGHLFLCGRIKELIIIRGKNIYPTDLENTLKAFSQLRPGCIVALGIPLAVGGESIKSEKIVLVAELRQEVVEKFTALTYKKSKKVTELTNLCSEMCLSIAQNHSVSATAVLLLEPKALPKTTSGKLKRAACKLLFETALESLSLKEQKPNGVTPTTTMSEETTKEIEKSNKRFPENGFFYFNPVGVGHQKSLDALHSQISGKRTSIEVVIERGEENEPNNIRFHEESDSHSIEQSPTETEPQQTIEIEIELTAAASPTIAGNSLSVRQLIVKMIEMALKSSHDPEDFPADAEPLSPFKSMDWNENFSFGEVGFDSIQSAGFIQNLQSSLSNYYSTQVELQLSLLYQYTTIDELCGYLESTYSHNRGEHRSLNVSPIGNTMKLENFKLEREEKMGSSAKAASIPRSSLFKERPSSSSKPIDILPSKEEKGEELIRHPLSKIKLGVGMLFQIIALMAYWYWFLLSSSYAFALMNSIGMRFSVLPSLALLPLVYTGWGISFSLSCVLLKWLLIGSYKSGEQYSVDSSFYYRHWFVERMIQWNQLIFMQYFHRTILYNYWLLMLGMKIRNVSQVSIDSNINSHFDLISISNYSIIERKVLIKPFVIRNGKLHHYSIEIGENCLIRTKAIIQSTNINNYPKGISIPSGTILSAGQYSPHSINSNESKFPLYQTTTPFALNLLLSLTILYCYCVGIILSCLCAYEVGVRLLDNTNLISRQSADIALSWEFASLPSPLRSLQFARLYFPLLFLIGPQWLTPVFFWLIRFDVSLLQTKGSEMLLWQNFTQFLLDGKVLLNILIATVTYLVFVFAFSTFIVLVKRLLLPSLRKGSTQQGSFLSLFSARLFQILIIRWKDFTVFLYTGTSFPVYFYRLLGSSIGNEVILANTEPFQSPELINIANQAFVGDSTYLNTNQFEYSGQTRQYQQTVGEISIGKCSLIGMNAVIQPNTTVPDHCIIGAATVFAGIPRAEDGKKSIIKEWEEAKSNREVRSVFGSHLSYHRAKPAEQAFWSPFYSQVFLWYPFLVVPFQLFIFIFSLLPTLCLSTYFYSSTEDYWLAAVFNCALYWVHCLSACFVCILFKWILLGTFRPQDYPVDSFFFIRRLMFTHFEHWAALNALIMWTGCSLIPIFFNSMGSKLSLSSLLYTLNITEPDLLEIGSSTYVGEDCILFGHAVENGVLQLNAVKIGSNCSIDSSTVCLLGSNLSNNIVVHHSSAIMKNDSISVQKKDQFLLHLQGIPAIPVSKNSTHHLTPASTNPAEGITVETERKVKVNTPNESSSLDPIHYHSALVEESTSGGTTALPSPSLSCPFMPVNRRANSQSPLSSTENTNPHKHLLPLSSSPSLSPSPSPTVADDVNQLMGALFSRVAPLLSTNETLIIQIFEEELRYWSEALTKQLPHLISPKANTDEELLLLLRNCGPTNAKNSLTRMTALTALLQFIQQKYTISADLQHHIRGLDLQFDLQIEIVSIKQPTLPSLPAEICQSIISRIMLERRVNRMLKPKIWGDKGMKHEELDLQRDYPIIALDVFYEFRFEWIVFAGGLANLYAFFAPAQSSLFHSTRVVKENPTKRAIDTFTILDTFVEWGPNSLRGGEAAERLRVIHQRYFLPNNEVKFTLGATILPMIIFLDQVVSQARVLTQLEREAIYLVHRDMGNYMSIQGLEGSIDEFKQWFVTYAMKIQRDQQWEASHILVDHCLENLVNQANSNHLLKQYMRWSIYLGASTLVQQFFGWALPDEVYLNKIKQSFKYLHEKCLNPRNEETRLPFLSSGRSEVFSLNKTRRGENGIVDIKQVGEHTRGYAMPKLRLGEVTALQRQQLREMKAEEKEKKSNPTTIEAKLLEKEENEKPLLDPTLTVNLHHLTEETKQNFNYPPETKPCLTLSDIRLPSNIAEIPLNEVKLHDGATAASSLSLWVIIDEFVYDLNALKGGHPGGNEILLRFGGKDASRKFNSSHSMEAKIIATNFIIGKLKKEES